MDVLLWHRSIEIELLVRIKDSYLVPNFMYLFERIEDVSTRRRHPCNHFVLKIILSKY